jgi:hypothetical protein
MTVATGFDLQPLPDGNVLIGFFGDDGKTFNTQIVTPEVVHSMPLVAALTKIALEKGPWVAKEIMGKLAHDFPRHERQPNEGEPQ